MNVVLNLWSIPMYFGIMGNIWVVGILLL
jgi:hypothetical protein